MRYVTRHYGVLFIALAVGLFGQDVLADDASKIDALLAKANLIPAVRFDFITTTLRTKDVFVIREIMKVYRKGNRWRFESRQITPGQYTLILPGEYYTCLPGPEGCRRLTRSDVTDDAFFNRVKDPTKYFKLKKIVGRDTIDGKSCTVLELTDAPDEMPYKSKVWIWDETGMPLRIESQALPDADDKSGAARWPTYENKNFVFEDIPDSLFEEHPDPKPGF